MRLYPCYLIAVNPITKEETFLAQYESRMECARAVGCSSAAVSTAIYGGYRTRMGCYIRDGVYHESDRA